MNPSRTRVATGADHVNDIAVYSLPDLDPVMVGFRAHSYWIFDIIWLDDDHVVSGAGDNKLALWSLTSNGDSDDDDVDYSATIHRKHAKSSNLLMNKCKKTQTHTEKILLKNDN